MQIIKNIKEMQELSAKIKKEGKTIGFVPTMGYLHIGHRALILNAVHDCDITIVSIFVNPLQFGASEDLNKYPRNIGADTELCKDTGVTILFMPEPHELTSNIKTHVNTSLLDKHLCGASRPGHFQGVCTIVTKLFNIVLPDNAYFGRKDIQQLKIIEQMVEDLNFPVKIIPVDTIRDSDGLAYSSRNSYLNPKERITAQVVPQVINFIREKIKNGLTRQNVLEQAQKYVHAHDIAKVDYIEIAESKTLQPTDNFSQEIIIAVAIYISKTRLIDNHSYSHTDN